MITKTSCRNVIVIGHITFVHIRHGRNYPTNDSHSLAGTSLCHLWLLMSRFPFFFFLRIGIEFFRCTVNSDVHSDCQTFSGPVSSIKVCSMGPGIDAAIYRRNIFGLYTTLIVLCPFDAVRGGSIDYVPGAA